MYKRPILAALVNRLNEPRSFIQALIGPRQVGKTTLIQQAITAKPWITHYASADAINMHDSAWIEQQWAIGRLRAHEKPEEGAILILDEIQKISDWSENVKLLWDQDTQKDINLKVVLLGSSPLLMQQGLTETLAGRFEILPITHWNFNEMQQAFGWNLEQFIFFGAYPGAAPLVHDQQRWASYIRDSLIETTIARDILSMTTIKKPALLRQLFYLGCNYASQILSYQKMLGQLHDAGNTTTLAHYLQLLSNVGMLTGLEKFSLQTVSSRGSSPKLQPLNTALISAQQNHTYKEAVENRDYWGRLVEAAVGAYLANNIIGKNIALTYWRERNQEVDFVLIQNDKILAIEVKSGNKQKAAPGIKKFREKFPSSQALLVGGQGISLEEFLQTPISSWL